MIAPLASKKTETFLYAVGKAILDQIKEQWPDEKKEGKKTNQTPKSNTISNQVKDIQQRLNQKKDLAAVPTDKTNSIVMTKMQDYKEWTKGHLKKNATLIPNARLTEVKNEGLQLLEEKRHILSNREARTIEQALKSKAVPTPKLLIKDHKKLDKTGNFPTRLVVPATNFTSSFPKAGYLGIKKIFDDNEVNYMERTIIQASDLKEELEKLGITSNNTTIVSIDAEAYYPSIKLKLVRKAIHHFSRGLKREDRTTIELHRYDQIWNV